MGLFYFNIVLTIAIVAIFWFIRVVQLPLLSQLPEDIIKSTAEKRKFNLATILFPLMAFEFVTTTFLFFLATRTEAYFYFAAAMGVQLIGLLLFFLLRQKSNKEYDIHPSEITYKKLRTNHLIITLVWSFRLLLIILSILAGI